MRVLGWGTLFTTMLAMAVTAPAQVKAWEGSITLPTYEEGMPDSNPPFSVYTNSLNYPYTLRTNLKGNKSDHDWRAIFLENEYLKCTVLPDLGGHIYTCIDKVTGQSMFYANPSIKKAAIGYRGAWAAFGVEFNFPVSHNWVSLSPVDYSFMTHPDGSASAFVGNVDRVYGMQWGVELILRPGSMLLEERVSLYNRSDTRHRYYWWNNAAVQVWDDSRIDYPMKYVASHGFTQVLRWPISASGKNLSIIGDQTDGYVSYFVHGSREPFMGIWSPKTQTGVAHYAEYSELPAKKTWSWGADRSGLKWRNVLSDNDSAYVEVQSGLFRNQETFAFLDPGQAIHFSEYWMPVRGTGGISRANKCGVVWLQRKGSQFSVSLNVNERLSGTELRILQNGKLLWSDTADLDPERPWSHEVATDDPLGKITFELRNHSGKVLLQQTEGEYDWDPDSAIQLGPQPAYLIPTENKRTEDDWVQLGADQESKGKEELALSTYEHALALFPQSFSLQKAAGRLAISQQGYEKAETWLHAVRSRDTTDAEAAYYLGIAEEHLNQLREARASYEAAFRQLRFRARAATRIGVLLARQGDLQQAQVFLRSAVDAGSLDVYAVEQLEAVTRALGERHEADVLVGRGLMLDPTSDFAKEEAGTPNAQHLAADPYRVLRVAAQYMELGMYQKALDVLARRYPDVPADQSEPGSVLPQKHPLVLYYTGYCKMKLGSDPTADWRSASQLSTQFIFPSTDEDRIVLEAVLTKTNEDATAHYLLGTLLFSKAAYDDGVQHWMVAKRLVPKRPVLDADLGKASLILKNDPQRAFEYFQEGLESDPSNAELYIGLDESMSLIGASARERAAMLERYSGASTPSQGEMPSYLVYQLALTKAEAGQFDQALSLFKNRFFQSEEGGIQSEQVLFEIRLMQAESEAKTGHCRLAEDLLHGDQDGLELDGALSQGYLRLGKLAERCHQPESRQWMTKAASGTTTADLVWAGAALQFIGTYDVGQQQEKLQKALPNAKRIAEDNGRGAGWKWYNVGLIEVALSQNAQGREAFQKALLMQDSFMSHHFARKALEALNTQNGQE